MRHRTILSTLLAIAAVIGLVVVGTSDTASSHNKLRAHMDATLVAPSGVTVGDDLVSYVGTFEFRGGRTYGYAAFSPGAPGPIFDDYVEFTDRYEVYDTTDFYTIDDDGLLTSFDPPPPIFSVYEWGFGSFAGGEFHALGVVTQVADEVPRIFRHVDAGNRVTWSGAFTSPTEFHAAVQVFVH